MRAAIYQVGPSRTYHSVGSLPSLEYVNHLQNRPRPSDGQTDLGAYEYRVPAFSAIRFSGNDCLLDFTAATGNQYDLQSTSNLAGNFWSPVRTNIPGTDGTIRIIDTNAASESIRFYRVQSSL